MSVYIENEINAIFDFDCCKVIRQVAEESLRYVNCPYKAEINVVITDSAGISALNKDYRGIDSPTDVLSFPMIDYDVPGDFSGVDGRTEDYFNPDTGELMLGDIVLCRDKIASQAKEYGHSELRETAFLVAHSMFHLFGYDHEEQGEHGKCISSPAGNNPGDTEDMYVMQEAVLTKLGIRREAGTRDSLADMYEALVRYAIAAMEYSYSPYSHFRVGAAILTGSGEIYGGCNIENSSYGLTLCAERTAAVKAAGSEKDVYFKAIAIVSDSIKGFTYPCGACRQFLAEFSGKDTKIILYDSSKRFYKAVSFEKIFPNGFRL